MIMIANCCDEYGDGRAMRYAFRTPRPDISRADFIWCMLAIDWGPSPEEAAARRAPPVKSPLQP